jgi:limonene-1,2-epoxide hydrolase
VTDNPVAVVSEFFALFGPSHDQMVAAAQRYCHEDMYWASAGYDPPRITSRARLVADLEKAKANKGISGFTFDIVHIAANGPIVLTERFDNALDADGNLAHAFKVMGILKVEDGRIRWFRDYFYDTGEFAEHYLPEPHVSAAPKVLDGYLRAGD